MIRRAVAIAAVIAFGFAVPATAGPPAIFDNQYEGRVERNPTTYFGFDVIKRQGEKKVAKVTALLRYNCVNGSGGDAAARARGKLRVEDDRFRGTVSGLALAARAPHRRLGPSGLRVTYRLKGRLLERGRAKGTIDATLRFTPVPARGDGLVRCYTGELDWKARRGADVNPPL
jgi:hypothetical protein